MRRMALCAVVFGFAVAPTVDAAVVLSESFTGEDLYNDSRVSFPNRTPQLIGSSLRFEPWAGTRFYEKLFTLSLVPANTLSIHSPVVVEFSMNLTVQPFDSATYPRDHDPGGFVGDGNMLAGFLAADNFNGVIVPQLHSDDGTHGVAIDGLDLAKNVGYPDIGESFDVDGRVTLLPDSTEVYASFQNGSATHVFSQALDRTRPLNFTFIGQEPGERYQVNSLSIEVSGEVVPEPSSLIVWSLIALTFGGVGW